MLNTLVARCTAAQANGIALIIATSSTGTRTIMRKYAKTVLCGALLALGFANAHAEEVTVAITAEVTNVYDPNVVVDGRIQVGDQVTGYYVYDTSTPELGAYGNISSIGFYKHVGPQFGVFLEINGYRFETQPGVSNFTMVIENNVVGGIRDVYSVATVSDNVFDITASLSPNTNRIQMTLADDGGTAVSNDALPSDAPVLSQWPSTDTFSGYGLQIVSGGKTGPKFTISGRILSATKIP